MTEKVVVIIGAALVLGTAGVPYGIFERNGMGVCRGCKNSIDALDSARATWFKRKRPAA